MPETLTTDPHFKILIVEDDKDTRRLLKMCVQGFGHDVAEAGSVEEGLKALAIGHFDVLISDIGLPDGTGWELLEKAPANSIHLAIAMSGFGKGIDRTKSEAAGFRHHLVKPFDPDKIEELLRDFAHAG